MEEEKSKEPREHKKFVQWDTYKVQQNKLEKLMSNIDKPVEIPERPKDKKFPEPPQFVRNVMGSSAGAGSGEFHVYRHLRRKEMARTKFMEEQAHQEELERKFQEKMDRMKREAEERTAKKRQKRLKKKEKLKKKKKGNSKLSKTSASEKSGSDSESDDDSQPNEEDDKNKYQDKEQTEISKEDADSSQDAATNQKSDQDSEEKESTN